MNALAHGLAGALLLVFAAPAPAQAPPLPDPVIRLTPEQREAALEAAAAHPSAARDPIDGLDRGVHGEMGVEIGTNGTRAVYGTAIVPLGQTGTAAISILDARTSRTRWRNR